MMPEKVTTFVMPEPYVVESESIITRNRAKEIVRDAVQIQCSAIDLSKVEFVSRSVADEFIHQREKHNISLIGLSPEVEHMISAVEDSSAAR